MLKIGYRIRLRSRKGPDREGVITAVTGSMLRVRWQTEDETTVIPAPGTLTVLAPAPPPEATKPAAKKTAAKKTGEDAQEDGGEEDRGEEDRRAPRRRRRRRPQRKKTAAKKTAKKAAP